MGKEESGSKTWKNIWLNRKGERGHTHCTRLLLPQISKQKAISRRESKPSKDGGAETEDSGSHHRLRSRGQKAGFTPSRWWQRLSCGVWLLQTALACQSLFAHWHSTCSLNLDQVCITGRTNSPEPTYLRVCKTSFLAFFPRGRRLESRSTMASGKR